MERSFLTRDTFVPIGFLAVVVGGVFWLSGMFSRVNETAVRQEKMDAKLTEVLDRTARIETALNLLAGDDVVQAEKEEAQEPTATIKANGASMIYHLASCGSYAATIVGNDKGDKWFSTESEAVANGFRKAKNCP